MEKTDTTLCAPLKEFFENEYQRIAATDLERELFLLQAAISEKINNKVTTVNMDSSEYYLYCLIAYLQGKKSNDFSILNSFILDPNPDIEEDLLHTLHRERGIELYSKLLKRATDYLTSSINGMKPLDPFLAKNSP